MAEKIRKKWTKITEQCFLHGCVVGWFQQYVYLAGQQQGGVTSSSPQRNSNALPLDTVLSPHHRLQFLPNPLCGYPRENIMYCGAQLFLVNSLPKFHVVTKIPQVLDRTGKSLFHSSEQVVEASHSKFNNFWEQYKVGQLIGQKVLVWGENFRFGRKFWVLVKSLSLG